MGIALTFVGNFSLCCLQNWHL